MPDKIVIRTPNHLGDCVMALPMISECQEAYPNSTVTLAVPENLAALFESNPAIDDIIPLSQKHIHGLLAVTKIKELLSPSGFDIGYILPPSFGSAAGFKLAGIKERIGYIADGRRLLLSRAFPLSDPINSSHRSELYFNLLRRATGSDLAYVKPKLFLNDTDIENGQKLLSGFGYDNSGDIAVIAVRSVAESRRWGTENYLALVKQIITDLKYKVILIGSDDDRPAGESISEMTGSGEVVNLAGKTSLRELASIMSQSALFVGNDSGPAHLAAAVGCPIVVLSGADDPASTSPISSNKKLIYLDHLDCISCVKNKCSLKDEKHMQCMKGISVEMVMTAIRKLINR